MRAFLGFVRKETLHLLRDRQTLAILILFPVVQVLIFGFAVRTDVRDIAIAIVDPTPDVATIELRERIAASDRFHIVDVAPSAAGLDPQFRAGHRSGRRWCSHATSSGGSAGATRSRCSSSPTAAIPTRAASCMGYAQAIVERWYRDAVPAGGALQIEPQARLRYNPTLESAHLFVPGLVAFVLTIVSALMTAISITREKETGTMEMLLVSPIRPTAIVAGKVMPYIVLGFVSVLLVLVAARTRVRRAPPGQPRPPAGGERALHRHRPRPRHPDLDQGAEPAHRDDRGPGRAHDADAAAVGIHLPASTRCPRCCSGSPTWCRPAGS